LKNHSFLTADFKNFKIGMEGSGETFFNKFTVMFLFIALYKAFKNNVRNKSINFVMQKNKVKRACFSVIRISPNIHCFVYNGGCGEVVKRLTTVHISTQVITYISGISYSRRDKEFGTIYKTIQYKRAPTFNMNVSTARYIYIFAISKLFVKKKTHG
jgi:hypothetical protein